MCSKVVRNSNVRLEDQDYFFFALIYTFFYILVRDGFCIGVEYREGQLAVHVFKRNPWFVRPMIEFKFEYIF